MLWAYDVINTCWLLTIVRTFRLWRITLRESYNLIWNMLTTESAKDLRCASSHRRRPKLTSAPPPHYKVGAQLYGGEPLRIRKTADLVAPKLTILMSCHSDLVRQQCRRNHFPKPWKERSWEESPRYNKCVVQRPSMCDALLTTSFRSSGISPSKYSIRLLKRRAKMCLIHNGYKT